MRPLWLDRLGRRLVAPAIQFVLVMFLFVMLGVTLAHWAACDGPVC